MANPRPVHFEIHASDPERAAKFYTELFGWEIKKWEGGAIEYWMVMTGPKEAPGINGGMLRRHGDAPAEMAAVTAFVCTMEVPNIDEMIEKGQKLGGTIALPKSALPGMMWMAYLKDTEGNIFGMVQNDPNAA